MKEREVRKVEKVSPKRGSQSLWYFETVIPEGLWFHIIPDSCLEFRAAEYGIDPIEKRKLLDMILYQQMFPAWDMPNNRHEDPAVKAGLALSLPSGVEVPLTPYNSDKESALKAFELRMEKCKKEIAVFKVHKDAEGNPFDIFCEQYVVDLGLVDKARRLVDKRREVQARVYEKKASNRSLLPGDDSKESKFDRVFGRYGIR